MCERGSRGVSGALVMPEGTWKVKTKERKIWDAKVGGKKQKQTHNPKKLGTLFSRGHCNDIHRPKSSFCPCEIAVQVKKTDPASKYMIQHTRNMSGLNVCKCVSSHHAACMKNAKISFQKRGGWGGKLSIADRFLSLFWYLPVLWPVAVLDATSRALHLRDKHDLEMRGGRCGYHDGGKRRNRTNWKNREWKSVSGWKEGTLWDIPSCFGGGGEAVHHPNCFVSTLLSSADN